MASGFMRTPARRKGWREKTAHPAALRAHEGEWPTSGRRTRKADPMADEDWPGLETRFLRSALRASAGVVFQPLKRVGPVCSWDHPTAGCAGACADEPGTDISFLILDPAWST
jgi:hypothetical protein